MITITDILTKTGKATAREIAAIMKIDARDVLTLLREHEQDGLATCLNGHWQLARTEAETDNAATARTEQEHTANTAVKPEESKGGAEALLQLLTEHGAMTTEELAKMAGVTSRKVASTLAMPTSKGRVLRLKQGGKLRYSLPGMGEGALQHETGKTVAPAPAAAAETAEPAAPSGPATPLKVIWSAPEDVQVFPTLVWVRQRRKELKNEMRWLSQIENIARQIDRKRAAVAYFREQV